jgi:hypothetical protein
MSGALIFRLVLLVLVAIAWAWLAFRAVTAEGGFGAWLRAPETKRDRSTLVFLTFVLAAMVAMLVLLPAG